MQPCAVVDDERPGLTGVPDVFLAIIPNRTPQATSDAGGVYHISYDGRNRLTKDLAKMLSRGNPCGSGGKSTRLLPGDPKGATRGPLKTLPDVNIASLTGEEARLLMMENREARSNLDVQEVHRDLAIEIFEKIAAAPDSYVLPPREAWHLHWHMQDFNKEQRILISRASSRHSRQSQGLEPREESLPRLLREVQPKL